MKLALKVDVDTHRGTREGVPALIEMLKRHDAGATFLFSVGPDHTGRAIRRALRPGFMGKVDRTSVFTHYGLKTLLYGTLLPGPDIGRRNAAILRRARDEGFEAGIHAWDHVKWQDGVGQADEDWTQAQMERACERFREIFAAEPLIHGAAGWQMNRHAFRRTQSLGFHFASDTRGTHPFLPVIHGEIVACPQFPTTLPTLDELIGLEAITPATVAESLLARSAELRPHVFTLHAELEGMKLAPVFEALLAGWKQQGYSLVSLGNLAADFPPSTLPLHSVVEAPCAGRSGTLATQGPAFPGSKSSP
jgi:undecaprenyl phosphate-alpha-L-ara4FN deformylase